MAGVDSTGFVAKDLLTIQGEINAALWGTISPTLNLSATSLMGEFVGATSSQIAQTWEAAQDVYAGEDIDQATGDRLTAMCRETGTNRKAATASRALMTVTLAAGTYGVGALVVHVQGDPTARFSNISSITTAGATLTGQIFDCETLGAVRANPATLTVIADPIVGFSNPTNPAEAVLGLEEEADYALRVRQKAELARRGSHTVDAIRVDIADVTDVTFVRVIENDTNATVDSIPAHAFETIVLGGTTQAIVDALLLAKPAGIQAYGTTSGTAVDTQGVSHTLAFTRPTEIPIFLDLAVTVLSGAYAGDAALKTALTDWADANLGVGTDVLLSRLVYICLGVAGVVDASAEIGSAYGVTSAANFVVGSREIATLDNVSDPNPHIVIAQTIVTGAP